MVFWKTGLRGEMVAIGGSTVVAVNLLLFIHQIKQCRILKNQLELLSHIRTIKTGSSSISRYKSNNEAKT